MFKYPVLVLVLVLCVACTSVPENPPLIQAAWSGNPETVAALLKSGADPNQANHQGLTPLMASTWGKTGHGDLRSVKALLAAGATVNGTDTFGRTALMNAAASGNLEIVTLLLASGAEANIHIKDVDFLAKNPLPPGGHLILVNGSALHEAAANGHVEIVSALLKKGAQPNWANSVGQTPLMLACGCNKPQCPWRLEIVTLLLAAGADVNQADYSGRRALSPSGFVMGGTAEENKAIKQVLKNAGALE